MGADAGHCSASQGAPGEAGAFAQFCWCAATCEGHEAGVRAEARAGRQGYGGQEGMSLLNGICLMEFGRDVVSLDQVSQKFAARSVVNHWTRGLQTVCTFLKLIH